MSSKTTNFNLHKIDLSDAPPDITVLNQNWDTLDEKLKEALDKGLEGIIPISQGGTGADTYWKALKNLANLDALAGAIPNALPLVYSNLAETGVIGASTTTELYCKAMKNYQCVTFIHNAENQITLTDIPMNYGVCTLFRGYNNNYLVGLFISTEGNVYRYKYHTTAVGTNGWREIGASSLVPASVE